MNEYLPYYAIGANEISQYIYSKGAEQRLLEQFESVSAKLRDQNDCYNAYLEHCRALSFYGCAFFKGFCYKEVSDYKIWASEKVAITLGLNRGGITIFKGEMEEVLSYLPYDEISWDYKQDGEVSDNGEPVERFIIEYDDDEESRQIQIISKQSCLMDAMVSSSSNFLDEIQKSNLLVSKKKLQYISYRTPTENPGA